MAASVVELTDADFGQAIGKGVVVVDFYGTWCPPCKLLEPVMDRLASQYAGRAVVAKINVDEQNDAAVDHTVDDIPTIIVFKDGTEVERLFGAQSLETLSGVVDKAL